MSAVPATALLQACIDAGDALRRNAPEGEAAGKLEGACARACIQRLRRALQDVPTGEKGMFLEQAGAFLEDLHNSGRIDYCGLEPEEHLWLARALHDRTGLLEDLLQGATPRMPMEFLFPYHLFPEGSRVAIYGAGDVGRKFYQQAKDYGWVKCVVIVDKNAEKINIPGIPVAPVGALKQFKFDKVLISMTNEEWANEARETLIRMGIADERIKWAGKIYWREHFYRQYWFEYLRFIHEMRRSKI